MAVTIATELGSMSSEAGKADLSFAGPHSGYVPTVDIAIKRWRGNELKTESFISVNLSDLARFIHACEEAAK